MCSVNESVNGSDPYSNLHSYYVVVFEDCYVYKDMWNPVQLVSVKL